MAKRGRPPGAKGLVDRQLGRNRNQGALPAGDSYIIPNLSGDHSAGTTGTPNNDLDIANKKYVDDQAGGGGTMTTVKEGGTQLGGADIVTLDFDGTDFDLTESPDTEVNITINDGGIDHTAIANIGTNTHAQIDTHIADVTGDPHAIASDTLTWTNKTLDANGTGNSVTNIDLTADVINDLPVTEGGTGASVAATALTNLGGIGAATTDTLTNKTFDANGTGNTLSNVDVADLANGTDGELITWSATGVAATVPVGTATHVLTSNGVGTAPTFQAATGSATKEIYWDSTTFSPEGEIIIEGTEIFGLVMTSTGNFFLNLQIPEDFTSLDAMEVMIVPDATETVNWSVESTFAKAGELVTANTDSQTSSLSVVDNTIIGLDIAAAFTNIEAGDIVGFKFNSDTSDIRAVGVRMKYS